MLVVPGRTTAGVDSSSFNLPGGLTHELLQVFSFNTKRKSMKNLVSLAIIIGLVSACDSKTEEQQTTAAPATTTTTTTVTGGGGAGTGGTGTGGLGTATLPSLPTQRTRGEQVEGRHCPSGRRQARALGDEALEGVLASYR